MTLFPALFFKKELELGGRRKTQLDRTGPWLLILYVVLGAAIGGPKRHHTGPSKRNRGLLRNGD